MATLKPLTALFCFMVPLAAPLVALQNGVSSEWDLRKTTAAVAAHANRLRDLLDKLTPKEWVEKGAPETYVQQWNAGRSRTQDLVLAAQALSAEPEKLTAALEAFFRLQALDSVLNPVAEAVHKYQNPALAELLRSVMAENDTNAGRIREHLMDLAKTKELEFQVVDQEAQRCRAFLSKQPTATEKRARDARK